MPISALPRARQRTIESEPATGGGDLGGVRRRDGHDAIGQRQGTRQRVGSAVPLEVRRAGPDPRQPLATCDSLVRKVVDRQHRPWGVAEGRQHGPGVPVVEVHHVGRVALDPGCDRPGEPEEPLAVVPPARTARIQVRVGSRHAGDVDQVQLAHDRVAAVPHGRGADPPRDHELGTSLVDELDPAVVRHHHLDVDAEQPRSALTNPAAATARPPTLATGSSSAVMNTTRIARVSQWCSLEGVTDSATTPTIDDVGTTGDELSDDIRLLGRILGDVIREHAGVRTFDLIERVRQIAVDGRRRGTTAIDGLVTALDQPIDEQLQVIRAFDWLALLANTAEDVHVERRRRHHRALRSEPQPGSLDVTFARLAEAGVSPDVVADVVAELEVSPVITAHPTEVRRKTILSVLDEIATLLTARSRLAPDDPERLTIEDRLEVKIVSLWQTALLRLSKLRVRDEINEALRYYPSSLFEVVPALIGELSERTAGTGAPVHAARALRMGSWIGGDRDGNPFVTADVLRFATGRHAQVAFEHYLITLERLSRQLSMSARLVTPTAEVDALADASGDDSPFRVDEPYRRALRGMYARTYLLAEQVLRPDFEVPGPPPVVGGEPYTDLDELLTDLRTIDMSLRTHGAGQLADAEIVPLVLAVEIFGAHLSALDMRQNSAIHEQVIADLFAAAGVCADYLGLDEDERVAVLTAELATPRPLRHPAASYSELTDKEMGVLDAATDASRRLGPHAIPHYVISMATGVSDVLEVAVLLKEAGLLRPGLGDRPATTTVDIVPLFETIGDLANADRTLDRAALASSCTRQLVESRGNRQEVIFTSI